jgi:hypothetical protein
MLRILLVTAFLTFIGLANSRADDLLQKARQERELATQQAEAEVRKLLARTQDLKSAEILQEVKKKLIDIQEAKNLDPERKGQMVQALQSRVRLLESEARVKGDSPKVTATPDKQAIEATRLADFERQKAEIDRLKDGVNRVNKLLGQRRASEAEAAARELTREFPDHPAAKVLAENISLQARIREAKEILARQERNITLTLRDVTRSGTPIVGDMEIDKERWLQNLKSKFRGVGDPLSEKEKALLAALNKTMQPDWQNKPLQFVLDELQKILGTPLAIDRKALEEAGTSTESLVTLSLPRPVTLRTVLRKILQDHGLGYVIKDEMIVVTTYQKTREMMTTRTYDISDLVTSNALTTHPVLAFQQEREVVQLIIDSIKRSVDPMSWEGEGGKGTIQYHPLTKTLIVRQSAEVHMMLRGSLGGGR